jgi:hypothetical protein
MQFNLKPELLIALIDLQMTLVVEVHFAERQTEGATEYRKI